MTAAKPEQDLEELWEELTYTASNPIQGRQPFTYPELKDMFVRLVQAEVAAEFKALSDRMQEYIDSFEKTAKTLDRDLPGIAPGTRSLKLGWVQAKRLVDKRLAELYPPQQPPTEGGISNGTTTTN